MLQVNDYWLNLLYLVSLCRIKTNLGIVLLKKNKLVVKNKKVLKNKSSILKKASIALFALNAVFYGHQGHVAYKLHKNKDKDNKQILEDAKVFNADLENYFKDVRNAEKVRRLAHNGNEPIYVTISKGFSGDEIEKIKSAFTYIENIFKDINSSYRFEYVENNLLNKLAGKVTIDVKDTDNPNYYGRAYVGGHSMFKSDYLINSKIELRTKKHDESERFDESEWFSEAVLHEILHLFQMQDLYKKDMEKEISTSFIFVDSNTNIVPELTPQDYRALHAVYNKNYIVNGVVDKEKLADTVNLINLYEQNYYSVRANIIRNNYFIKYNYQNITSQNAEGANYKFKSGSYDMSVQLNNGKYNFNVTHRASGENVSSDTGDYLIVDGAVVLKNVETNRKYYNTSILSVYDRVADFMILQTDVNDFKIIDVADISTSRIIDKRTVNFDLVDLRNNFFKVKEQAENKNKSYHTPSGHEFSIDIDEKVDSLGLFR